MNSSIWEHSLVFPQTCFWTRPVKASCVAVALAWLPSLYRSSLEMERVNFRAGVPTTCDSLLGPTSLFVVNVRQTQNFKACTFIVVFFCFSASQAQWSEDFFYNCSKRSNAADLFGTLKVQSFFLTEVSDCGLLIVVTSSTFLRRKKMLKRKKNAVCLDHQNPQPSIYIDKCTLYTYTVYTYTTL